MSSHHTSSHYGGSHYASSHFGGLVVTLPALDRLADPSIRREPFDLGYWRSRYGITSEQNIYTFDEAEQAVTDLNVYGQELAGDLDYLEGSLAAAMLFDDELHVAELNLARDMVLAARRRQDDELAAIVAVLEMFY